MTYRKCPMGIPFLTAMKTRLILYRGCVSIPRNKPERLVNLALLPDQNIAQKTFYRHAAKNCDRKFM